MFPMMEKFMATIEVVEIGMERHNNLSLLFCTNQRTHEREGLEVNC
jgi:hypothetical protein